MQYKLNYKLYKCMCNCLYIIDTLIKPIILCIKIFYGQHQWIKQHIKLATVKLSVGVTDVIYHMRWNISTWVFSRLYFPKIPDSNRTLNHAHRSHSLKIFKDLACIHLLWSNCSVFKSDINRQCDTCIVILIVWCLLGAARWCSGQHGHSKKVSG